LTWSVIDHSLEKVSIQLNGYDCGIFILEYYRRIVGGCFSQNDIAAIRLRIAIEIINNRLHGIETLAPINRGIFQKQED